MPYVPSRKTDMDDREVIDLAVAKVARYAASKITNNLSLIRIYRKIFLDLVYDLSSFLKDMRPLAESGEVKKLAQAIYEVSKKYEYEGAYLGELNYAITQFIQLVPNYKFEGFVWDQELRYWIYVCTVDVLVWASRKTEDLGIGVSGVFVDAKDEYKRRVNAAYEAEQILKNGDCYFASYYTRLVEIVDEEGKLIGHQEIMMKRSDGTVNCSLLDVQLVARKKKPSD